MMSCKIATPWYVNDVIKDCVKKYETFGDVEIDFLLDEIKEKLPDYFPAQVSN